MRFETKAIHIGSEPDPATGAIATPIYQTSTYVQEAIGKHKGYEYSRTQNPTRTALEKSVAALEGGRYGLAFSSGMAAISTVLNMLRSGIHVISSDDVYGGTYRIFEQVYRQYGLEFTYVDTSSLKQIKQAIKSNTRLIWVESPTNPLLKISDIEAIARICKRRKLVLGVDNTFASPYFQNPLALGADLVVHSSTKFLGGHADVVGGAICTSNETFYERLKFCQNAVGAVPGPFDCFLVLRGIKTLAVRMRAQEQNAHKVARFLSHHSKVKKVYYPGLKDHPGYDVARRQMSGFGSMLSFEVDGGLEPAKKVCESTKIFKLAESLGGVESLIEHPALMTHSSIPKEIREAKGVADSLIRLSIGIEHFDDLIDDLRQALV